MRPSPRARGGSKLWRQNETLSSAPLRLCANQNSLCSRRGAKAQRGVGVTSLDRLIHMANQISANLATDADPVAATAHHIRLYWDPRMKSMITAHGGDGLSPHAAAAIARLSAA
jgi:formate dehydrogenase subunit delta